MPRKNGNKSSKGKKTAADRRAHPGRIAKRRAVGKNAQNPRPNPAANETQKEPAEPALSLRPPVGEASAAIERPGLKPAS